MIRESPVNQVETAAIRMSKKGTTALFAAKIRPERDDGAGVSGLDFLLIFGFEVVPGVLGLPISAREVEGIENRGVYAERVLSLALELVLGDNGPFELAGALFEQGLERAADVAFVIEVETS